ncbi:MAG: helix-hairpin-helix domain-containing protein [Acidobacteriota bacterium]
MLKKSVFLAVIAMFGLMVCASVDALAQPSKVIDINAASVQELDELPGIGPAIAARIVEYREKNGPFSKIEDLMEVRGIGEKKFLNLQDRVTVGAASQPDAAEADAAKRGAGKQPKPSPEKP